MHRDDIIELPKIYLLSKGDHMKLNSLDIEGIGGIKHLHLDFNNRFNVICGPNGVGKSTILNIIADIFTSSGRSIKRNTSMKSGSYTAQFIDGSNYRSSVTNFKPTETNRDIYNENETKSKYLMYFNTNREINYISIAGISSDPEYNTYITCSLALDGISATDIKSWFVNRYLYSFQSNGFSDSMRKNLDFAKEVFGLLDDSVDFSHIDPHKNDIILRNSSGEIYFEYLSSGYKTCIYIILGIIKEIEFRFDDLSYDLFDGLILIDEVDLHLHPTWQAQLVYVLKQIFTNSQIIVSTHSPSILQSVEGNEIIALGLDDNNEIILKDLDLGEYGLQGWTLEEIMKDVMGMPTTTSKLYRDTMDKFDEALDAEHVDDIKKYYDLLLKMLHPDSVMRRLLKIQIAGFEE